MTYNVRNIAIALVLAGIAAFLVIMYTGNVQKQAHNSQQTTTGRYRMTRPSRRSSLQGTACGVWIRAWGQREPAVQGTGRLNRSAPGLGWLKGGLDIPAMYAECRSRQWENPLRTLTRSAWSRARRI